MRLLDMRRPITTINPHIGDESFISTFGRMPTAHDDVHTRVATHVGYAARLVRERDASHLSHALQTRRAGVLDALDAYVAADRFPASETDHGLLPTFLDPASGVRCAVAHLVETTAGTALMEALDRDHHNDYVAELAGDARFTAWAETSGLTVEELAWIQPSYPPPPPPEILYVLAATGQVAVSQDDATTAARSTTMPDSPTTIGMLDASLRYVAADLNHFIGKPRVELGGGLGMTTGEHTAYDVHAMLGSEVRVHHDLYAITAGVAVDAYGPALPRAWTLPLEVSYHRIQAHASYGIHAGPRFALDDARELGVNAGLEYRRKDLFCDEGRFDPRDLLIGVDVTRLADATFIGLSVGIGNPRSHHWYED
ncbi:MAG: hypothetical protein ABI678_32365 [Kofleriaceae bacterium]